MDFISQKTSVLFGDSAFVHDSQKHKFILTENQINSGVKEQIRLCENQEVNAHYSPIEFNGNLILFQSLRILYLNKAEEDKSYKKPLVIDYVVIAKDAKVDLTQLRKQYIFNSLIFDSSNKWWKIKQLKLDAESLGIPYWDVNEKGAFVFKLSS